MNDAIIETQRANIGLIGLSGYGDTIRKLLLDEGAAVEGRTRLAAVFAPDADQHGETIASLLEGGTRVYDSFQAVLDDEGVDAVWLPVPIHLHRAMATAVLRAGKHLMLEKPVAGCIDDHDALAEEAKAAGRTVLVGFQDIYRPTMLDLKRRLLAGEFGTPKAASVWGLWPRSDAYYARNGWAGSLKRDNQWVLDSPLSNAMAHYVNLALYLLGPADADAAEVERVKAELWKGRREIENFDTCSLRVGLANTCDLVVTLAHATDGFVHPSVEIDTDRGTLRVEFSGATTFDGEPVFPPQNGRPFMAQALGQVSLGKTTGPVATLASSRPHSVLVSAAVEAAKAVDLSSVAVTIDGMEDDSGSIRSITGLAEATERAAAARQTLGEFGFRPGDIDPEPGMLNDLTAYRHFKGPRL